MSLSRLIKVGGKDKNVKDTIDRAVEAIEDCGNTRIVTGISATLTPF